MSSSLENDGRLELEAAYRQHANYVFKVCIKFAAGDRDWALDRAHDVFMQLSDKLETLSLEEELRPWLRKVAINECLMDLRRRERRQRLLRLFGRSDEASPAAPERELSVHRDVVALDRALGRLPAKQRMLLGLIYFEGETLTDAAKLIGVSKGQASKLRRAALEKLARGTWETSR
jgi:RNA polymerase sigma-70 factor (ECF subfamily)